MREDVLVSIGIPFYNAEKYLKEAIQSVINQSYSNWELILLDDGSTDNSLEIAHSFIDKRIKVISDGQNKKLVRRLNELVRLSSGDLYARMDADDIMHFDRIKTQVDFLLNNTDVDVVGSSYYSIDIENNINGVKNMPPKLSTVKDVLKYGCFAHPTVMGRITWFKENLYDEKWTKMMEDFELWIRTVQKSNFRNINKPLLYYRNVGVPTIRKYKSQTFNVIKVIQARDLYNIHLSDSIYYSIKNYLKILTYICFNFVGKVDYLVKKRSIKVSGKELIDGTNDLFISIKS